MFGSKLLRVDLPVNGACSGDSTDAGPESFVTEFYGGSAIYALRPLSEDVGRDLAARQADPRPVQPVAYRIARDDSHDPVLTEPERRRLAAAMGNGDGADDGLDEDYT